MKMNISLKHFTACLLIGVVIAGCKKTSDVVIPPEQAHFADQSIGNYYVQDNPASKYTVPIGATTVSDRDRVVNFTVTSPTGAVAGTHYTISKNSVTIPAGQSLASVDVHGIFAGYPAGRVDTLIFTLTGGDIPAAEFDNPFKLVLQRYCNVVLNNMVGTYVIQDYYNNAPDGGPYTVQIISAAPGATATTGSVMMTGLWGITSPAVKVDLDWTDPANFKTNIPANPWFFHPTYGQSTIRPNGTGTFSSCDNTLLIRYEATVAAGSFGKYYSTMVKQ